MGSCQSASAADKTTSTPAKGYDKVETAPHPSNGANIGGSTVKKRIEEDMGTSRTSSNRSGESRSRHEQIMKWKEDLCKSGNLTKAIVRIEVSA